MRLLLTASLVLLSTSALAQVANEKGTREPPPGFTSLFNGKDLSAWKDDQPGIWVIADGTIYYTGKGGKNLNTAKDYGDFEFYVDWKITKGGDSGIYLRGRPQVQIWQNKEGSGGLWNNAKDAPGKEPAVVADNPVGEWNTFYIKMVGPKVTIKLNDKLVVDNADMLAGKVPPKGPIGLQVHGSPLWFRNVFVRELDSK